MKQVNGDLLLNGNNCKSMSKENKLTDRNEVVDKNDKQQGNYKYGESDREIKMSKIYVGNLPNHTNEEEVMNFFGLNATEYLKNNSVVKIYEKERKRTRVECVNANTREGCKYKHQCKFIHTNEYGETKMYAIVNIPHEIKDDILKIDKMEFNEERLIIEDILVRRNEEKRKDRKDSICRYFIENRCRKGIECEYKHERKECKFFEKGLCKYGEQCKYIHVNDGWIPSDSSEILI